MNKSNRKESSNYRPIDVRNDHGTYHLPPYITSHFDSLKLLVDFQHGFRKGYSCETQLITVVEEVAKNLDYGSQTDLLLLDLSKAFDTVPHQRPFWVNSTTMVSEEI